MDLREVTNLELPGELLLDFFEDQQHTASSLFRAVFLNFRVIDIDALDDISQQLAPGPAKVPFRLYASPQCFRDNAVKVQAVWAKLVARQAPSPVNSVVRDIKPSTPVEMLCHHNWHTVATYCAMEARSTSAA
mmetsp:Transcript_17076/g.43307  ORF Transcript_17076/g.43307 Transcript_17076/m.43307 type:complete len:133 (-) Transcript_17076:81-479(-)